MDAKTLNLEDRISDLPDAIIHHILSFLPSTREAIQTGILSKRWHNQWTHVPVLIFNSCGIYYGQSHKDYIRLIENSLNLYDCSKIKKFHLCYRFQDDPDFDTKLRFATRKHVEQLILNCYSYVDCYMLPKFLIDNSSLVELKLYNCRFRLDKDWTINWPSLKTLEISDVRPSIGKLIPGCPMLESLKLMYSAETVMNGDDDVIASNSLKRLFLTDVKIYYPRKIICPNLVELVVKKYNTSGLCDKMIEISCPKLESVDVWNSRFKLLNCMSLLYADLGSEFHPSNGKQIVEQLQHVKVLRVKSWFIETLSTLEMEGISYPMLNNKLLVLHATNFEHLPGFVCALRSSPALERLVINFPDRIAYYRPNLNDSGENYLNAIATDFNCLVPRLKFVELYGLSKEDPKAKNAIHFIEFILKNARVLEKLVLAISKSSGIDFAYEVSRKVLTFSKGSPHVIIDVSL